MKGMRSRHFFALGRDSRQDWGADQDRAIIINREGEIILDRAKYEAGTVTELDGLGIACLHCDEMVLQGLPADESLRIWE
ncbi:hypothetical protein WJ0W_004466 [Paenibacillus melissococcoides]|uniref:CN hydrolase domain-containing protein n=2 Tax=Paenibacillus TaxID=44249 RepID=A0ABM9G5U5_9BACL|nr:hypothetical protein WJ0W_004466 [Paenibacillus melissococcoides]